MWTWIDIAGTLTHRTIHPHTAFTINHRFGPPEPGEGGLVGLVCIDCMCRPRLYESCRNRAWYMRPFVQRAAQPHCNVKKKEGMCIDEPLAL